MLEYYRLLGLSTPRLLSDEDRTRAIQDVERARRRLALQHHPDRNPADVERATRTMQEINKAADYILGYLKTWHAPASSYDSKLHDLEEWMRQWSERMEAARQHHAAERMRQAEEQRRRDAEEARQREEAQKRRVDEATRRHSEFKAAWENGWYTSQNGNPTIVIDALAMRVTIFTDKRTGQYKYVISDMVDDDTHFSKLAYATVEVAKAAAYHEMIARYF